MLDADRQIRFLYPPIFFVASLFLGIRLDNDVVVANVCETLIGKELFDKLGNWSAPVLTVATAGGLVATIAVGFLISSVTVLALRGFSYGLSRFRWTSKWCRSGSYEAPYLLNAADVRRRLDVAQPLSGSPEYTDALFLSASLDHELIPPHVHTWMLRRWTMFYVYAHSATALILALGIGFMIGVKSWGWLRFSVLLVAGFIFLAVGAWHDTMGMLKFQAQRSSIIEKKRYGPPE